MSPTQFCRRLRVGVFALLLLPGESANAYLPPPYIPLTERVQLSTHIFVGKVQDAYFIDSRGTPISPRQAAHLSYTPSIELKILVQERLLWRGETPTRTVLFRPDTPWLNYYPSGQKVQKYTELIRDMKGTLSSVYLARRGISKRYFVASYSTYDWEDVKQRETIRAMIRSLVLHHAPQVELLN